ncbi:MAG TPA: hypothetical protein VLC50_00585 [Actinomycetes bacterium]|nr:hypothetical protein [Actinomycetes bacterium]
MARSRPVLAVYLEQGAKKTFACAADWPGWCRSGKTDDAAIATLLAYADRYAAVAAEAGLARPRVDAAAGGEGVEVLERVAGSATTDFGAPGSVSELDRADLDEAGAERLVALLQASWVLFDRVVAGAPAELRKGPRGGGRDRDKIVEHVLGAEAGYARQIGVRRPQPDPADRAAIEELRAALVAAVTHPDAETSGPKRWPPRYAVRRIAWHVLDHAWEIEDRAG